ncbi:MAG: tetratricopeptide repeat protein [Myxococcota bacterium]|nr:tetratricopeptide repeat protein [Myxococcota bacterium]
MLTCLLILLGTTPAWASSTAESLLRRGDVDGALSTAQANIQAEATDLDSHEVLIDILINRGMAASAARAYEQLTTDNPGAAWAWSLRGRASQNPNEALKFYDKAIELDPSFARAWAGRGDVERALDRVDAARRDYKKTLKLDPSLARAWTGLGALYIQEGSFDQALETCEQAIAAAPHEPEAYLAAAQLAPQRALSFLEQGARAIPDEVRLHAALGHHLLGLGQHKEAARALQLAQQTWPDHPESARDLYILGCINRNELDSAGREELERSAALSMELPVAALDLLQELAIRYPSCNVVQAGLGHQLFRADRVAESESSLRKALAAAEPDPKAKSWNQGSLGMLLASQGRHAESLPLLQAASQSRSGDVDLAVAAGVAVANVEGPRAGAQALAQTAQQFPTNARPVMALATLLSSNGDTESAYTVLQRAASNFQDPNILLALAGAAKDAGHPSASAKALRELHHLTGDPTWLRAAKQLESAD